MKGGGADKMMRRKTDQFDVNETINRLNSMQLGGQLNKGQKNVAETPSNASADTFGRSLSQEEVISTRSNGLSINNRNSLLRSSSDCTGSSRRQVHPQPLMSRYAFERRSIRRSKV